MCESERASGRDEEHIPLFCDKSLAIHLADAVIRDIGAVCARREVGVLSISHAAGAIDERLRVLRELNPARTVGRLLERVEARLVADVLDSVHASRVACECDAPVGQERRETRERKEAKEREEREERTSVSDSVPAHPKPETENPEINPKPKPKPKQGATTAQAQRGLDECDPARPDSDSDSDSASVGARGLSVSDSDSPRAGKDLLDPVDPSDSKVNPVDELNEVPLRAVPTGRQAIGIGEGC